ncbi:MAG: DUF2279 domain-containing protein [Candidatus Zhuqueibacterota bacterium]
MKKLLLAMITVFVILCVTPERSPALEQGSRIRRLDWNERHKIAFTLNDSTFGRDKVHHFLSSAFLTTAGYYFCREEKGFSRVASCQGGISFSLSLGLLKEIRDGRQPENAFSVKDLVANILGTAVGLLIVAD